MNRKKLAACLMSACLLGAAVPAQGILTASAEEYDYLNYWNSWMFDESGNSYQCIRIGGCDESFSGDLVIPDEIDGLPVAGISYSAFKNCTGLTSVTIPASVKEIGGYAFEGCTNLTELHISENNPYYSFENGALYDKEKTTLKLYLNNNPASEFTVPDTVTTIAGWAFEGSKNLTSVTIPESVEVIAIYAFDKCPNLTELNISENNASYCFENGALYNKEKTALKQYFANNPASEFVIPETVTEISGLAFEDAVNLTAVSVPESVEYIGSWAFKGCTGLTSIELPSSMEYLGAGAFYHCESLTSAVLPENLNYLNYQTFAECPSLTSVTLPGSLLYIGRSAFENCSALESVSMPASTAYLMESAFAGCTNLNSVDLSENLNFIDLYAFEGCTSLKSIKIPDSVDTIFSEAFSNCSSLESIVIPEGVSAIYDGAFSGCTSLTSVTLPESITWIGKRAFDYCESLLSVAIPDKVSFIGYNAFDHCTSLTEMHISENNHYYASENGALFNKSKTTLKQYFMGNTAEEYTVPDTVTRIGGEAFMLCDALKSVTIPETVTDISYSAFYDVPVVLYGYEDTEAQYYAKDSGHEFVSLGAAPEKEYIPGDASGDNKINILDVILVNKAVLGKEALSDAQVKAVDFNQNSKPDSEESLTILKYIVGLVTSLTA